MMNKTIRRSPISRMLVLLVGFLFATGSFLPLASAQVKDLFDTKEELEIFLYKGDLVSLKVYSLTRIAVQIPGIVELVSATVDAITLLGKKEGATPMFIWDEYGKRRLSVRVLEDDLEILIPRIEKSLKLANIEGISLEKDLSEGRIVATGKVVESKRKALNEILKGFKVANAVIDAGRMIQIDAQVSQLTTTLSKELGVDWTDSLTYQEDLPQFGDGFADFFKIGDFDRTTTLQAVVSALITEGKGRILSKPSIVVANGQAATFLVGGEFPIVTSNTSSGGTTTENVNFKPYGVNLSVTPTINEDKIDVTLNVSVSDVDQNIGNAASFTTTTASTLLKLKDKQTIVLAGLIKHNKTETVQRVPFLGSVPILGLLFRKKTVPESDQEIVISLTPRILEEEEEEKNVEESPASEKEESIADLTQEDKKALTEEMAEEPKTSLEEDAGMPMPQEEALLETSDGGPAPIGEIPETAATPVPLPAPEVEGMPGPQEAEIMIENETQELIKNYIPSQKRSIAETITEYVKKIQQRISKRISFPYQAQKEGWEGKVTLTLTILSDGGLADIKLKRSSGYVVFDRDAVNTAQILAPYDPFPAEIELEELVVTIPIVYSQDTFFEDME